MRVIIMAQGQQTRLEGVLSYPKHLLWLGGQTIIGRTLRLLNDLETIVIGPPDLRGEPLFKYSGGPDSRLRLLTLENPGLCILDGIEATANARGVAMWGSDRTIILMGDVIYSRAALQRIIADRRPLLFAGSPTLSSSEGELFALAFDLSEEARVKHALATTACRQFDPVIYQVGHLRNLFWDLVGQQYRESGAVCRVPPPEFMLVDDWTDDIDVPEDLKRLSEFARLAAKECLP